nr:FHA domain-containing protein [Acidimicrobiia bacterium]
ERKSSQLTVVEPAGMKGRTYDLGEELTVGRAAGCQVTLDDNYVSQLHARIFTRDGMLFVEDLGSTNGTYLNTRRVSGPEAMKRGDQLKIGSTVMELSP